MVWLIMTRFYVMINMKNFEGGTLYEQYRRDSQIKAFR